MRFVFQNHVFRFISVSVLANRITSSHSRLRIYFSRRACSSEITAFPPFRCSKRLVSTLSPCIWPSNLPPATEWGYGKIGPATWPSKYPDAGGQHQSPVDIDSAAVHSREFEPPLHWNYLSSGLCKSLLNTGCGWRVDVQGGASELSGGPLSHSYELVQFHCHWGAENSCGSEHTVDGKSYAGELHFVHWNKEKFACCADAVPSSSGLTVIGVFLEVGEANSEIEKLCGALTNVPVKDDKVDLDIDIDPAAMYPADHSYWTYSGSLTTPPCYESVTWIVFKNPITISEDQLKCFRQMKRALIPEEETERPVYVEQNFRPPQSLNDREICECTSIDK